jgi:hypothetical protein
MTDSNLDQLVGEEARNEQGDDIQGQGGDFRIGTILPVDGQKGRYSVASSVSDVLIKVLAETSGVEDLEAGPCSCEYMREERRNDMRDRLVQQSYHRHSKDPELEGNEDDVLALGVIQAG